MANLNPPPKDVEAHDLFQKLLDREDPHIEVEFPRAGVGMVRLHLLTDMSVRKAKIKALEEVRKLVQTEDRGTDLVKEIEGDMVATNVLALSAHLPTPISGTEDRDNPVYPRMFFNSDEVSKKLTGHEIATLFAAYMSLQRRFGPGEHDMTDDDVNEWILRLKDGADGTPFWRLDWHALAELFQSLAARACCLSNLLTSPPEQLPTLLESLPTAYAFDTGSAGSPQEQLFQPSESLDVMTAEEGAEVLDRIR